MLETREAVRHLHEVETERRLHRHGRQFARDDLAQKLDARLPEDCPTPYPQGPRIRLCVFVCRPSLPSSTDTTRGVKSSRLGRTRNVTAVDQLPDLAQVPTARALDARTRHQAPQARSAEPTEQAARVGIEPERPALHPLSNVLCELGAGARSVVVELRRALGGLHVTHQNARPFGGADQRARCAPMIAELKSVQAGV